MSKRLIPILFIFLCACSHEEPTALDFEYERIAPLMYRFTNLSTGFDEYRWDFGNGTFSLGTDAMYCFDEPGTYDVTLTGTVDGARYDCTHRINVTTPSVYIAGYTLYHIPYENRYYKVVFKDDNLLPSSWDFETAYTRMLDNEDMPYTVLFNNPYQMHPESHTYYTIQVVRTTNASTTDNDVSCMKQKLKTDDILRYNPEYVLQTESGTTAIGVLMEYKY